MPGQPTEMLLKQISSFSLDKAVDRSTYPNRANSTLPLVLSAMTAML